MGHRARILNISYERMLLDTRSAVLRAAGHAVRPARTFARALKLLQRSAFDLVIIGHSIPDKDTHSLVAAAHASGTPVLLMVRGTEQPDTEVELVFAAGDGPGALLWAIGSLLQPKKSIPVAYTCFNAEGAV